MSTIDVEHVRQTLQTQLTDLLRQIEELDTADEGMDYDENFADSGQVAAEQGENQQLLIQFRDQIGDVETALARLDDGTYGTCEVCGKAISEARLEALPATRFCIDHA